MPFSYLIYYNNQDSYEGQDIPFAIVNSEDRAKTICANDYFSPEDNITIDIGQRSDGSYGLVEINFLETSSFYNVDKDLVYAKLAKQLI